MQWYRQFKALDTNDPSVLYAKMKQMKRAYIGLKYTGWMMLVVGILMSIIIIGLFPLPIGIVILVYAYSKTLAITVAYRRYCQDAGVEAI
jgi:hypothetical protein